MFHIVTENNHIQLDNNYVFELVNSNFNTDISYINITNIKLNKLQPFIILINFNSFQKKDYKKILKKLLYIKNYFLKFNLPIGININSKKLLGYLQNYDSNNQNHIDFLLAINAIFYDSIYERYNYIYDTVCEYLDNNFHSKNLCDFKNNKCGEKINTSSVTGCCRHFKNKFLGPFSKLVVCEYLTSNYVCSAKCISCKLFTCDYLKKKGINFKINDILLLNVFFNPLQKYFIKYMVFTPKDKILKKLLSLRFFN